ncbi:MAG: hypothetical protein ACJ79D_03610, partial [Myxococcales bacterium]
ARAHNSAPVPWKRIHESVMPIKAEVQIFPIVDKTDSEFGICLARGSVSEANWSALRKVLSILMKRFGFLVFDLQRGVEVRLDSLEEIRTALFD